jgi:CheY-like chemotaxis protein
MILLVEDEALARRAFAQILRFEGHEVMEAADGVEALILLEKYHFDLVITDLVMPNINGLSLIARIQVKWPKTAILLTSAAAGSSGCLGWKAGIHSQAYRSTVVNRDRSTPSPTSRQLSEPNGQARGLCRTFFIESTSAANQWRPTICSD